MKIKIRKDALDFYIESHTAWNGEYFGRDSWEIAMSRIAGKILEVDTRMLFKDEYNTKPIPGVSKKGIRVTDEYVDEIIDDVRRGKARCDFCNSVSNSTKVCTNCGKTDYLDVFIEEW